jgi:hypothetical protein
MGLVVGSVGVLMGRGTAGVALHPARNAGVIAMPAPIAVLPPPGGCEVISYPINAIAVRL